MKLWKKKPKEASSPTSEKPVQTPGKQDADTSGDKTDLLFALQEQGKTSGKWKYPSIEVIERELEREKQKGSFRKSMMSTVGALVVVAAVAVLVTTLWFPVLQVTGNSMTPTFAQSDVLLAVRTDRFSTGEVIAFYYNNKILVKRVIARSGDWVDIDEDGNVFVNEIAINEPYLTEKSLGDCNIELPYQVPEGRVFVMGDHRSVSIDSRNSSVGCISDEQIVGKVKMRIWPFDKAEMIF